MQVAIGVRRVTGAMCQLPSDLCVDDQVTHQASAAATMPLSRPRDQSRAERTFPVRDPLRNDRSKQRGRSDRATDVPIAVPDTESFSLLLTALRTIAGHVDYAWVRPAGATAPREYDIEQSMGRPTLPAEYFSLEAEAPPLLAEYAIDAYVAQVLTSAHLAKAQSLKAFDIQPLGNDRFLVVANEPGEWLAPAATSPTERLQLARTEFGGMCSPIHKCCRTRSLHMTASETMRMWHSVSSAFWRPDPRRGAEPREPSYADETPCRDGLPRRFRVLDASRLRCGSACPRTESGSEVFHGLG